MTIKQKRKEFKNLYKIKIKRSSINAKIREQKLYEHE